MPNREKQLGMIRKLGTIGVAFGAVGVPLALLVMLDGAPAVALGVALVAAVMLFVGGLFRVLPETPAFRAKVVGDE